MASLHPGRLLAFVASVVLSFACRAPAPAVLPPAGADSEGSPPTLSVDESARASVAVRIRDNVQQDSWEVQYTFAEPAGAVRFENDRNRFRAESWVLDDGFVWQNDDNLEYVVRHDAAPFSSVTLRFASDFGDKYKDYNVNIAFSDGGRLLYTGHLRVQPIACAQAPCVASRNKAVASVSHTWRFSTDDARTIIAWDGRVKGTFEPSDAKASDTYVYFGATEPEPTPAMTMVIDPGMPPWMVSATRQQAPAFFAYFAETTRVDLDFVPVVLLSFGDGQRRGQNHSGGVLDGLAQLSASGAGWLVDSPENRTKWLRFLAHEVFHLWNGSMFRTHLGTWEEWLSEGSADLFAERALLARGFIDQSRFDARIVEAANECAVMLGNAPVLNSDSWAADNYYTCGMALLFTLGERIAKAQPNADVSSALARVFADARQRDRTYSTHDLFEAVVELTQDPLSVGAADQLLRVGVPRTDEYWRDAFAEAGLAAKLVPIDRASLPAKIHRAALASIIAACDCPNGHSVGLRDDALAFDPVASCNALRDGGSVVKVEGHSLGEAPGLAHAAAVAKLTQGKTLMLRTEANKVLKVQCPADRMPAYRSLLALQAAGDA